LTPAKNTQETLFYFILFLHIRASEMKQNELEQMPQEAFILFHTCFISAAPNY